MFLAGMSADDADAAHTDLRLWPGSGAHWRAHARVHPPLRHTHTHGARCGRGRGMCVHSRARGMHGTVQFKCRAPFRRVLRSFRPSGRPAHAPTRPSPLSRPPSPRCPASPELWTKGHVSQPADVYAYGILREYWC